MGKINVLDKHVAELIAAGEVVERPSSVIKELVENSIDAGATAITVEIKNGGVTYMRITDNGCGIERDDVRNAFLRNATSKIKLEDDLNNIATLGFRGEALFSVCAVSRVDLMTRTSEQPTGVHYKIEGGEEVLFEDCGCSQGTTIIVRDLFYNTPARMKFLKKDSSEGSSIAKILDRIALSHPEVAFKFIRENKLELNTPGNGKLGSAIYAVYGKEFFSSLMELDYKLNGVRVSGYISKPSSPRASRSMQHFFINNRYVKSRTAMAALEEAFKGSLIVQKFPSCVMNIEIPFDTVDVNVHPAKVEVRFVDERPIFDAVYHGVKTALLHGDRSALFEKSSVEKVQPQPTASVFNFEKKVPEVISKPARQVNEFALKAERAKELLAQAEEAPEIFVPKKVENIYAKKSEPVVIEQKVEPPLARSKLANEVLAEKVLEKVEQIKNNSLEEAAAKKHSVLEPEPQQVEAKEEQVQPQQLVLSGAEEFDFRIRGEIFNTYIIVEKNNAEMVLIDKHAAHERMIFEELKSKRMAPVSQLFLEPVVVSLSKDEYAAIVDNMDLFTAAGFDISDFGNATIIVRAAPSYLENVYVSDIIVQMATYILEHRKNIQSDYERWLWENIACRAAIKAGRETKPEELQALVQRILEEDPRYCPHGRPVAISMKKYELEKRFGRV